MASAARGQAGRRAARWRSPISAACWDGRDGAAPDAFADACARRPSPPASCGARAGKLRLPDPADPVRGSGLDRPRHGQARRRRAQLFQRHRPHRPLRSGAPGVPSTSVEPRTLFVRLDPAARARCCRSAPPTAMSSAPTCGCAPIPAPRRSPSRSRRRCNYYESRGQNWERAALIKARPVAGDMAAGEAFLARTDALHLAQISRLRRHRRHPLDQAPDPRPSRPWRDRGRRPQHQARPRRHPRDRVLRPDPAADRRRPQAGAARRGAPTICSTRWRPANWISAGHARRADAAYWFLRDVEHRLQMIADEQTHTLPDDDEGLGADRPHDGRGRRARRSTARARRGAAHGRAALRGAVRAGAARCRRRRATSSSPATTTIPARWRRSPRSASRDPRRHQPHDPRLALRPLSGDALGERARAADRVHAGCCSRPSAPRGAPTRRCCASTASSRACRPASSSSRCSPPTPGCSTCSSRSWPPRRGWPRPSRARPRPRRAARPGLLGRAADAATYLRRAADGLPGQATRLRGRPRPRPHLRPGAAVPDRRAPADRLDQRRARRRGALRPRRPDHRRRCSTRSRPRFERAHGRIAGGRVAVVAHGQARQPRDDRRLRPRPHPALRPRPGYDESDGGPAARPGRSTSPG